MPIIHPILPPKPGYVEVEVDGVRTYKNTKTGVLIENEDTSAPTLEEQLATLQEQTTLMQDVIDALLFADNTTE